MKRPLSPEAHAVVEMARQSLSRRRLLQIAGVGGAAAAVAACGAGGGGGGATSASATVAPSASDKSDADKTVIWSNWISYIDENSLNQFKAATGITVTYNEDINDNNDFYAKVLPQLESGQSIDRDIVVLTDWMAALWIQNGFAQKLDKALIPNSANLIPRLRSVGFDPSREFTLPWQSGFGVLGWNKEALKTALGTDTMKSVDQLWDPKLKGRVTVLSEMRDTMGIILAWQGADPSNFTEEQFNAGIAALQEQVDNGQIRQVTGNDYVGALESGDVIAVIGWSGDIVQLGDAFGSDLPETGGTLWTDNMLIPPLAPHKKNAELLMNFYYDPKIAAEVAAYVQYICPVEGAQQAMEQVDPSLVDAPYIFPDAAKLDRSYVFMELTPEQDEKYQREFQKAIGN